MKIVIDIPKIMYGAIKQYGITFLSCDDKKILRKSIANGSPLPKGHGDLIDKEKLKANINGWYAFMKDICKQPYMTLKQEEIIGKIDIMTPIIEADKESDSE